MAQNDGKNLSIVHELMEALKYVYCDNKRFISLLTFGFIMAAAGGLLLGQESLSYVSEVIKHKASGATTPLEIAQPEMINLKGVLLLIINTLSSLFIFSSFYRSVISGTQILSFDSKVFSLMFNVFIVGLISIVSSVLFMVIPAMAFIALMPVSMMGMVLGAMAVIIFLTMFFRLSFFLPNALGDREKVTFGRSFAMTKGYAARFVFLTVLALIISSFIESAAEGLAGNIFSSVLVFVGIMTLKYILLPVQAVIFARAYKTIMSDLASKPSKQGV